MSYSPSVKGEIAFGLQKLDNMLGDVVSEAGLHQLRIAETEKYAHVTFFFDGGMDKQIKNSERVLVKSPRVATYDLQPEMSAYEVTDKILYEIEAEKHDMIILNFANCDMVGHTGDMNAAIKACEAVDTCVEAVISTALEHNYTTLLIADHGNCETMINPDGSPNTAHTTNPVPVILIDKDLTSIKDGVLGDIAPTILKLIGIEKPEVMTQSSLI